MVQKQCKESSTANAALPLWKCWNCLSSDGLGAVGGDWCVLTLSSWGVGFLVGLVWAVDGDLDSDLTTLDLLAVHLRDSLLLLLLGCESDEAEATTLAGLVASLELLDHEAGNWAKGDLGGSWLVGSEEFLELSHVLAKFRGRPGTMCSYLLLGEIVWQVGNHDLVLGWDAISWWTTLATRLAGSFGSSWGLSILGLGGSSRKVGLVGQRERFTRGRASSLGTLAFLSPMGLAES